MFEIKTHQLDENELSHFFDVAKQVYCESDLNRAIFDVEHIQNKLNGNPLGASQCIHLEENGNVTARILLQPRMLVCGNKYYPISTTTDLVSFSNTPLAGFRIFKSALDKAMENDMNFLYNTSNSASDYIYRTILKKKPVLELSYKAALLQGKFAELNKFVNSLINMWVVIYRQILTFISRNSFLTFEIIEKFNPTINELINKEFVSTEIHMQRNDDLLNWRFAESPNCQYQKMIIKKGGLTAGYLVIRELATGNMNVLTIVDYVVAELSLRDRCRVLLEVILRASNAQLILVFGNFDNYKIHRLWRYLLIPVPKKFKTYKFPVYSNSENDNVKLSGNAYFTSYDIDAP